MYWSSIVRHFAIPMSFRRRDKSWPLSVRFEAGLSSGISGKMYPPPPLPLFLEVRFNDERVPIKRKRTARSHIYFVNFYSTFRRVVQHICHVLYQAYGKVPRAGNEISTPHETAVQGDTKTHFGVSSENGEPLLYIIYTCIHEIRLIYYVFIPEGKWIQHKMARLSRCDEWTQIKNCTLPMRSKLSTRSLDCNLTWTFIMTIYGGIIIHLWVMSRYSTILVESTKSHALRYRDYIEVVLQTFFFFIGPSFKTLIGSLLCDRNFAPLRR